jgi:hypothetical protein
LQAAARHAREFARCGATATALDAVQPMPDYALECARDDGVALTCVAAQLAPGGLYVIEMSHPRDAFGVGASTRSHWSSEAGGLRMDMQWGAEGDVFDPITQVDDIAVTMAWSGPGGNGQFVERVRQRRFTANEFDALVRAASGFDIVCKG